MNIVTTTHALEIRYGLKAAIKKIKEYGFDAYDCTLYESMKPGKPLALSAYKDYARDVRTFADSIDLKCTQTHSVLPKFTTFEEIATAVEEHKKAIEISAILGAEIIVIHPSSYVDMRANYERMYSKLLPTAKDFGIKIATENMFIRNPHNMSVTKPAACGTPNEFTKFVDFVNDESFTACLDIGHTYLRETEPAPSFIRTLGKRIQALHIHTNNGLDDQHAIPFAGITDWDEVCHALAEIDYNGNFTLEADKFILHYPNELLPYVYNLLLESSRYLINKIENYKLELRK